MSTKAQQTLYLHESRIILYRGSLISLPICSLVVEYSRFVKLSLSVRGGQDSILKEEKSLKFQELCVTKCFDFYDIKFHIISVVDVGFHSKFWIV